MVFKFNPGSHIPSKINAQAVGERIESIKKNNGGLAIPQVIVRDARSKSSPMHEYFEWDDKIAASGYRLEQARHLIRSIIIERPDGKEDENGAPKVTRAFVSVEYDDGAFAYTDVKSALSNPRFRGQLLQGALDDLRSWQEKYSSLEELAEFFEECNRVRREKSRKLVPRKKLKARAAAAK